MKKLFDIPYGEHLFQSAHRGEIGQMHGGVALALCPGDETVLDIVVHHCGGQCIPVVKVDQLAGHIRDDLIHIQRNIGQFVPGRGALLFQPPFEIQQFFHGGVPP